jgi:hypothetical protein
MQSDGYWHTSKRRRLSVQRFRRRPNRHAKSLMTRAVKWGSPSRGAEPQQCRFGVEGGLPVEARESIRAE